MVKDHLGNQYENKNQMAKAYNMSYAALASRLNCNWNLEKALTTPTQAVFFMFRGVKYKTYLDCLKEFNITKYELDEAWAETGYSQKQHVIEYLLTKQNRCNQKNINTSDNYFNDASVIIKNIGWNWKTKRNK